jgi:hypothetical protein
VEVLIGFSWPWIESVCEDKTVIGCIVDMKVPGCHREGPGSIAVCVLFVVKKVALLTGFYPSTSVSTYKDHSPVTPFSFCRLTLTAF